MRCIHTLKSAVTPKPAILAAVYLLLAGSARADIIISEVDSNGSGASYGGDWFELTNTGLSSVNISGWKMDDNSNAFANAVALNAIPSIAAGQSVIFIEGTAATATNFTTAWFGASPPAGFTIGSYTGSNVGLSTTADAVNIFDSGGSRVTGVAFGAFTSGKTFDNTAGAGSSTLPTPVISTLSADGVNGAFNNGAEIGSPGVVPEPGTALLFVLGATVFTASRAMRNRR